MASSMLRGFLNVVVLKALSDGPKSGYGLMKYVKEHMGVKPSPGSMYPLLEKLQSDEMVSVHESGKTKEYKLTQKGKEQAKAIEETRNKCIDGFIEGMKMLSALTGEDMAFPLTMVQSMKSGVMPFKEINPEWDRLRERMFRMMNTGEIKKKAAKVKAIIADADKKLGAI